MALSYFFSLSPIREVANSLSSVRPVMKAKLCPQRRHLYAVFSAIQPFDVSVQMTQINEADPHVFEMTRIEIRVLTVVILILVVSIVILCKFKTQSST
jgi:hypothetical protein